MSWILFGLIWRWWVLIWIMIVLLRLWLLWLILCLILLLRVWCLWFIRVMRCLWRWMIGISWCMVVWVWLIVCVYWLWLRWMLLCNCRCFLCSMCCLVSCWCVVIWFVRIVVLWCVGCWNLSDFFIIVILMLVCLRSCVVVGSWLFIRVFRSGWCILCLWIFMNWLMSWSIIVSIFWFWLCWCW